MTYCDIDDDTLIKMEITYLRMLQTKYMCPYEKQY